MLPSEQASSIVLVNAPLIKSALSFKSQTFHAILPVGQVSHIYAGQEDFNA